MTQFEELLQEKKSHYTRRQRATSILLVLSLIVTSAVFYNLRLTGITLAGDAHCGIDEHTHTDSCYEYNLVCTLSETEEPMIPEDTQPSPSKPPDTAIHKHSEENGCYEKKLICATKAHSHDLSCYSNDEADVETPAIWESTFASVAAENRVEALVEIAKTQVGYVESDVNFRTEMAKKQGYTRYGAWYGSPYGKWSAMFVSFCLSYAGFTGEETPYAQSSEAMRILWENKGLYKSKEAYTGQVGDVVFLADGLTGIIYKRMPDYIYAIIGDADNSVQAVEIFTQDEDILGYGLIPREENKNPYNLTPFTITVTATPKDAPKARMATFAARAAPKNIKDYLEKEINGSFELTLLTNDNKPILPDENGNVTLEPNKNYKVSITMHTGEHGGIVPGEYIYNLPDGVITVAGNGEIALSDGTHLGYWSIDDAGHIAFSFNENTNRLGDVLINITTGVRFPGDTEIDMDGNIHVTVRPDPGGTTELLTATKWGRGVLTDDEGNLVDENGNSYNHHKLPWGDPIEVQEGYNRIYWDVYITGDKDNSLAGYEVTDQITSPGTHYFSPMDMEAGIVIKYYSTKPGFDETHWMLLKPGTPGLEWTETGFHYIIPETLTCENPYCTYDKPISMTGSWIAHIDYFSTVKPALETGWREYFNKVYVKDQESHASVGQTVSVTNATINKVGVFNGHTGEFQWLVSATIPKQADPYKSTPWALIDLTKLSLNYATASDFTGAFYQPVKEMKATIGHTVYDVPFILDVDPNGEKPPLAYCFGWDSPTPTNSMSMHLLRPCSCTGTGNCSTWDVMGRCTSGGIWVGDQLVSSFGYCRCWNMDEGVELQISYTSPGEPVIEASKNNHGEYINIISLNHVEYYYEKEWLHDSYVLDATDTAVVPVPSLFDKVLTADPNKENSFIASYLITINESKVDLSREESIRVEDTMSNTLVYIPGTLVVKTEDANGVVGQLTYGEDYILTVGGSGNKLVIEIFDPGALKYSFYYDCRITVPPGQTSLLFDNAAKITLFGQEFEDEQEPQQVTNVAVSANAYTLNVQKLDAETGGPLPGAQIGFFAQNGERIMVYPSGNHGMLRFETDITKGIIMREHVLYYVQEVDPPPWYMLDETKHYLFFCNEAAPCQKCAEMANLENGATALRVQTGKPGLFTLYNRKAPIILPETGGSGPLIFYIVGMILMVIPCIYIICSGRRRKERRFRSRPPSFATKTWLRRRNR